MQPKQICRRGGTCKTLLKAKVEDETRFLNIEIDLFFVTKELELSSKAISRWV